MADAWSSRSATAEISEEADEHRQLGGDRAEQQPVRRPAERHAGRTVLRQAKALASLAEHDGGERGAGRGEQRGPLGNGSPGRQPAATSDDEERRHLDDGLDRAEHAERAAEQTRGRAGGAGSGGCSSTCAAGGSAPSASAGSMSVPMSRASICSTPSASGKRPPDSAQTTNGVSSATLSVRW